MDIHVPDFTKLHWQLNVAIIGAIFSIFSLIYNDKFIYYGFITFAYGVVGASLLPALEKLFPEINKFIYPILQSLLTLIWLAIGIWLFPI